MRRPRVHRTPLIRSLGLKNFRGFRRLRDLQLAPLTFLVGPNSSGKSSLADAIMFLAQSELLTLNSIHPRWTGPLVDLGSYQDAVYRHRARNRIGISAEVQLPAYRKYRKENVQLRFDVGLHKTKSPSGAVNELVVTRAHDELLRLSRRRGQHPSYTLEGAFAKTPAIWKPASERTSQFRAFSDFVMGEIFRPHRGRRNAAHQLIFEVFDESALWPISRMQRVSSARGGPARWYAQAAPAEDRPGTVCFDSVGLNILDTEPSDRRTNASIQEFIAKALKRLKIASEIEPKELSEYHAALMITDDVTGIESNLIDVGFGTSQILPVLRSLASAGGGPLFVEQPEVHLHPRAQGIIAELLAEATNRRQIFVETHSEHMINRLRIMIAERRFHPEDVVILYVDRNSMGSFVTRIELDDAGDFQSPWPDGFFDERYKDTMRLSQLKAAKEDHARRR